MQDIPLMSKFSEFLYIFLVLLGIVTIGLGGIALTIYFADLIVAYNSKLLIPYFLTLGCGVLAAIVAFADGEGV
jgi:hypothetical protein